MEKPFILGINGSPHKTGIGVRLLRTALSQSEKEGAEIKLVHLKDFEKTFFHGNYTTRIPSEVSALFKLLKEVDGVIFSTPVHWFNVSSLMKNFIDQLTVLELNYFDLEGKVAGFISTAEEDGGMKAILDMMGPLNQMGFLIPPYASLFYNIYIHGKSENRWMEKDARLLGSNILRLVVMVRSKYKREDKYFWDYKYMK